MSDAQHNPCPFCGSADLADIGRLQILVQCRDCGTIATEATWDTRAADDAGLPDSMQQALNSGDGTYRP